MVLFAWLLSTASAQEQVCASIYTVDELRTAVSEAKGLVDQGRGDRARDVLERTRDVLHCMNELVPRDALVAFAETRAIAAFLNQELEAAVRWGQLVPVLDPEHAWSENAAGVQMVLEDAEEVRHVELDDRGFLVEDKGHVFMDGAFLPSPAASTAVPHLVQVFNGKGHLLEGFWQDGPAFPERLLGDDPKPSKVPKYFDPATGVVTPKGKPPSDLPKRKLVPTSVWIGGGMVVASGVLYGLAGVSHGKLVCDASVSSDCPTTAAELTSLRTQTNLMVLGSGVLFLGGVGVGVTGFLSDSPGIRVGGRF